MCLCVYASLYVRVFVYVSMCVWLSLFCDRRQPSTPVFKLHLDTSPSKPDSAARFVPIATRSTTVWHTLLTLCMCVMSRLRSTLASGTLGTPTQSFAGLKQQVDVQLHEFVLSVEASALYQSDQPQSVLARLHSIAMIFIRTPSSDIDRNSSRLMVESVKQMIHGHPSPTSKELPFTIQLLFILSACTRREELLVCESNSESERERESNKQRPNTQSHC
jgi:hypothetical protein